MTKTWFTADPHFGHEKVSELRGFNSTDRHDEVILGHLHDSLSKGDNLWVLGDLSAGGKAAQLRALDIMEELKEDTGVTMHLIPGNHDGVHPMHRRSLNWYEEYLAVFESIQAYSRRKLAGRHVWVSHFPWKGGGDHTEDERYSTVRLNRENEADWLLHGHTHSPVKTDPAQRMINVGVDAWDLKPVTIHQVENTIKNVEKELSRRKEQEAEVSPTSWQPKKDQDGIAPEELEARL